MTLHCPRSRLLTTTCADHAVTHHGNRSGVHDGVNVRKLMEDHENLSETM
jgi:hypothetical protein